MINPKNFQQHSRELLEKEEVRYVLGYKKGTATFMATPAFFTEPDDAENLIWDPTCVHNLVLYLTEEMKMKRLNPKKADAPGLPVGIFAKGCDARAIVVLLQENYIKREEVHIIGLSCEGTGVLDERKLKRWLKGKTPLNSEFEGLDTFKVTTRDGDVEIPAKEILADRCLECRNPFPNEHDVVYGEMVEGGRLEPFHTLTEMEASVEGDIWDFWKEKMDSCIRCYACRSVCPMCYCDECVVDSITFMVTPDTTPDQKADRIRWIERSNNTSENFGFHLVRAMHLAGRCVDCGECQRVCPVDIPLRLLNTKLEKEALEMFDYSVGVDPNQKSLVSSFNDSDPDSFIR